MPAPTPPRDFDLLDGSFYDDPWDIYQWLRDEAPLWRDEKNGYWVVSRHEDVVDISTHPRAYSSADGVVASQPGAPISLITLDDPEHNHRRRFVSRGFTPRRVRELSTHIGEITNQIIDGIEDRGEIDFVADLAIHVPLWVIAEMIGFDPALRDQLARWSDAMMSNNAFDDPAQMERSMEAVVAYGQLCQEMIDARREDPQDDIISVLLSHEDELAGTDIDEFDDLRSLNDSELMMFLVLLMVAGNETTRNALSGGMLAFKDFPDERDRLIAHPELIDTAVDEIVRWVSPVLSFYRTVTEPHERHGQRLEAGDRVLMLYQAANRDERAFGDPDVFRIDRDPNPHVGFGIGAHYCLGANLARAEIKIVFQELFNRLPDITLAEHAHLQREPNTLVLALHTLPAVFTPIPTVPAP